MKQPDNGLGLLYLAVFLLALNGLFAKLIPLDALTVTQVRSTVAAIALVCFALLTKRRVRLESAKQLAGISMLGIFLGLHWVTFFHAMQVSTVAIGMLSFFTYPVITVFLEPLFHGRQIDKADVFAAILVFVGIIIMVGENVTQLNSNTFQGAMWGVLSACLFALRNVLQKYKFQRVSPDGLILYQVITIALMLFIFIDFDSIGRLELNDWLLIVLLGAVSTAMAHSLFSFSLKHIPAKSVSMIACLQPPFAALFAWLLLNEVPGYGVLIGGFIIVSVALYESVYHLKGRR